MDLEKDITKTEIVETSTPKPKRKRTRYLTKNTLGVLRTTLRNNIELTNIADNKANVLTQRFDVDLLFAFDAPLS